MTSVEASPITSPPPPHLLCLPQMWHLEPTGRAGIPLYSSGSTPVAWILDCPCLSEGWQSQRKCTFHLSGGRSHVAREQSPVLGTGASTCLTFPAGLQLHSPLSHNTVSPELCLELRTAAKTYTTISRPQMKGSFLGAWEPILHSQCLLPSLGVSCPLQCCTPVSSKHFSQE